MSLLTREMNNSKDHYNKTSLLQDEMNNSKDQYHKTSLFKTIFLLQKDSVTTYTPANASYRARFNNGLRRANQALTHRPPRLDANLSFQVNNLSAIYRV